MLLHIAYNFFFELCSVVSRTLDGVTIALNAMDRNLTLMAKVLTKSVLILPIVSRE